MEYTDDAQDIDRGVIMPVPYITAFCCCMGLELGSKIIGFLHLLASLALLLLCALFASSAGMQRGTVEDLDHVYSMSFVIAIVMGSVCAVHTLLAMLLIFSVYKRYTVGLRVWVAVMCVLSFVSLAGVAASAVADGLRASGADIFLSFLEGLVFYGAVAYCVLCVNSFYLMLKSSEDMEGPNKTEY